MTEKISFFFFFAEFDENDMGVIFLYIYIFIAIALDETIILVAVQLRNIYTRQQCP